VPQRSQQRLFIGLVILCAALTGDSRAAAQEYRATLTGQVTDTQAGVLPGVTVSATHEDTGTRSEAVTDTTGNYTFAFLAPGAYTVTAELAGFRRLVRAGVPLSTGQRVTVDLTLEVGNLEESVTVRAEAALLSTGTASVGIVVEAEQIDNLPMSGRAPSSLVKLSAGVTDATNPALNTRPFDNHGTSNFSMAGGQNLTNEMLLDGGPNMAGDRRVSYNPPADIVQEVKVETFQSDAAYGNTAGGTVNIVTKTGTNRFRGSGGWFTQPSELFGTNYFTKVAGESSPPFKYNQGGVTAGGPLVVPGLVDGRNRAFWIMSYDNIRNTVVNSMLTTVPTAAMRNGDFSELLALGDTYRIYDPLTGVADGPRRIRQPFANNVIPADRIDPIARAYLNYFPLPNQAGSANGQNNYLAPATRADTYYSIMGRTDINLDTRNRLMFKYYKNDRVERMGNIFGNIATGATKPRRNSGMMLDYVHTLRSTTMVNSRFGWSRFDDLESRESTGFDITSIGFPAQMAQASLNQALPLVTFGDATEALGASAGGGIAAGTGFRTPFDSFQWFTSLTAAKGRHTLKSGADLRFLRESSINFGHSAGTFAFGTQWTRGPLDNSPGAPHGQALASFLLGLPTGGQFDINTSRTSETYYTALFLQDDWRVNSSLTLNLGLRYERESGTTERHNRTLVGFEHLAANSVTAAARAAYAARPHPDLPVSTFNPTGGPIFASSDRRRVFDAPDNAFSPRVGVAYTPERLGGQTVFRGGFGVFYHTYGAVGVQQPGFSQSTPVVATLDGFLTPAARLSNPFPDGILTPLNDGRGLDQNLGLGLTYTNPSVSQPFSRRYTAGVQHQLTRGTLVELTYSASQARDLPVTLNLNYTPAEFLSTSDTRDQATINRLSANVANPFQGLLPGSTLNGPTVTFEQLLRAYPQYTGLQVTNMNLGTSDQHMVSLTLQRRFADGLQVLGTYTRSRMSEATSKLNASDTDLEWRLANEDRPHRFVLSGVYAMPFGTGGRLGAGTPQLVRTIISGWTVSGIYTYQSGQVATWGNVIYLGGDLQWDPRNLDRAFNTAAFNTNSAQQLDRNIRTLPSDFGRLRLDGINTWNLALIKNTSLGNGMNLQLRAETFNAFDRVQFGAPVMAPTNANFGRVVSQVNAPRSVQFAARLLW
jgi:hypothetical protein